MFTEGCAVRLRREAMLVCLGVASTLLVVLVLLLAAPFAGQAHAADLTAGSGVQAQVVKQYNVWVGGKQVTSANASNVLGDGHVSYNAKTQTLTLKNANIKKGRMSGDRVLESISYSMSGTFTIKLVGKNKISSPKTSSPPKYAYGIADWTSNKAGLKFTGSGSLTVRAANASYYSQAIAVWKGLTVQDKVKLYCSGGNSTQKCTGIEAMGGFVVKGSATIVASGETGAFTKAPKFSGYTPKVKAGYSSKSIKVNKKKPASSVYTKYPYVSITKASSSASSGKKPAQEKITSISSLPGGFSVIYKKITKNCKGYQVQYSTSNKFKPAYGTVYTSKNYNTAYYGYRRTGLSGFTRYYVRVRGWNKVGSKEYYGAWSPVKSVVTGGAYSVG